MDEIVDRLKSFVSKKLMLVSGGVSAIAYLPILYRQMGVSDNVALVALGTISAIVMWYCKVNKDLANGPNA